MKKERAEIQSKKTKIVEVIDFGAEESGQMRDNHYFSMSEANEQERYQSKEARMHQNMVRNDSDSMLKKLIENIRTSHALRNQQIRDQFKLSEI